MTTKTQTISNRYIAFSLGSENYAIPLLSVREVIAMPETTRVPHTPPHFLGIINLRGQVISIIDFRIKFKIKSKEQSEDSETAVIIVDIGGICLGVVIDSVNNVLNLNSEDIQDRPQIESHVSSDYITGVTKQNDKLIILLDIAKALDISETTLVQQNSRKTA